MREIKFRAFDKRHNKIFAVESLYTDQVDYIDDGLTKFSTYSPKYGYPSRDEVEIIQYTGLKDKNGKEIYEGDIVKYDDGENWETGREEVKFENGAFNICCFHPDQKEFIDEPRVIEIIGNIYENPELLTPTN